MKTNELMLNKLLEQQEEIMELGRQLDEMSDNYVALKGVHAMVRKQHEAFRAEFGQRHVEEITALEKRIVEMAPQKQFRVFGHKNIGNGIDQYALTVISVSSVSGFTTIDVALPDA